MWFVEFDNNLFIKKKTKKKKENNLKIIILYFKYDFLNISMSNMYLYRDYIYEYVKKNINYWIYIYI